MPEVNERAYEAPRERHPSDRRKNLLNIRWPDRRTGFFRRSGEQRPGDEALGWLAARPRVVLTLLVTLAGMNLLDFALTLQLLQRGAVEGNPVLAAAFAQGTMTAFAVKACLMIAIFLSVWLLRRYRGVLIVLLIAGAVYTLLLVYEVGLLVG